MATRYTQQMQDDGVKMAEGHIVFHASYGEVELAFNVSANGDAAYIDANGDYQFSHADELNPVQDLVDGAAYEFYDEEIGYKGHRTGLYVLESNRFITNEGTMLAGNCTNIIRLVPEVK